MDVDGDLQDEEDAGSLVPRNEASRRVAMGAQLHEREHSDGDHDRQGKGFQSHGGGVITEQLVCEDICVPIRWHDVSFSQSSGK